MKLEKKGQRTFTISDLGTIAVAFIVAAIVLSFGATVLEKNRDLQKVNGSASNVTGFGLSGVTTIAEFLPLIAIVVIAGIVIGIIMLFFSRRA